MWKIKWPLSIEIRLLSRWKLLVVVAAATTTADDICCTATLHGIEKARDGLMWWDWASPGNSSASWAREGSFPAASVPRSWRRSRRIQDVKLNAEEWPGTWWGKGKWRVRMHLDLEWVWLNAETPRWNNICFSVLRMLHPPSGWWCWKMFDCTTEEYVSGRRSSRSKKYIWGIWRGVFLPH